MKKILIFITLTIYLFATNYIDDYVSFQKINPDNTTNIYGNLLITGNTVMCVTNKNTATYSDWENNYQNFECSNDLQNNDNNYITRYLDIDNDSSTRNSTSAIIHLPSTYKEIVWAGIFWQGHINNYSYLYTKNNRKFYSKDYDEFTDDDITKTDANKIKLKVNNNSYIDIIANEVDYHIHTDYDNPTFNEKGARYSAWADITNIIKQYQYTANTDINFTVANIATTEGLDENHGDYGAWSIVIIYKEDVNNPASKLRNNSVYYGFEKVYDDYGNDAVRINIDHLVLPNKVGQKINTYMALFAAEGEYRYGPDTAKLNNEELNETLLYNGQEVFDPENVFDARLSDDIIRYPKLYNNNGIDIDIFNNVSEIMENLRDSNPGQLYYDVTITLESGPPNYNKYNSEDAYNPSVVVFSTELYQPRVCYYIDKIEDTNGNVVFENGEFVGNIDPYKKYKIKLWIANMKNSETDTDIDTAKKVKVFMKTNDFNYTLESTEIKNIGYQDFIHQTDASGDDLYTYIADNNESDYHLGVDANSTDGGTIEIATGFDDDVHKAYIDFNGTFLVNSGSLIDLDNIFNFKSSFSTDYVTIDEENALEIPKCVDFSTTGTVYSAITGTFNVVNMDYVDDSTIPLDDTGVNALKTQIVNHNFHLRTVKVKDDNVTVEKFNGIIKVSLIPALNYESLNETEKLDLLNSANEISTNYVPMGDSGSDPYYGEFNKTISRAVREGTYKIVYLVHSDGSIVESANNCLSSVPDYNCIWGMLTEVYTDSGYQNTANGNNVCPTGQVDTTACTCGDVCSYGTNGQGNGGANGDDHASEECLACVFGSLPTKASLARDSFSIRPYAFRVFGNNQYKKAAEEFNLTVKAVDEANNAITSGTVASVSGVADYNVSLGDLNFSSSFYTPTATELAQMQSDMGESNVSFCPNAGVFTVVNNPSFANGEVNASLKFSETGILTLNVSEINGSEFAKCDEDDTNDSQRLINPATVILDENDINKTDVLLFIPYEFNTTAQYSTTTGANWVYISNDVNRSNDTNTTPAMGAYVQYNIVALNKDGAVTQNFTKTCFPDYTTNCPTVNGIKLNSTFDLILDLKLSTTKDVNISLYNEDATDSSKIPVWHQSYELNTSSQNALQESVSSLNFNNGHAVTKVYFNINKDYRTPMGEVNLTVGDVNTSTSWMNNPGATNIFNGVNLNQRVSFIYGRIKVSNASAYDVDVNTTFVYQYWDDNEGWKKNTAHTAQTFGKFYDLNSTINPYITITNYPPAFVNGEQKVEFHSSHLPPFSEKVHLKIDPWLWYHPLAKNYQDPSTTNTDCLTHPCMTLSFMKSGSAWGGVQSESNNTKFNQENRTVDLNVSKKDLNVSKSQVKKINW